MLQHGNKLVNHSIDRCPRHNEQHDTTRTFERLNELSQIIITSHIFMRMFSQYLLRKIGSIIIACNPKSMVCHIERHIASHNGHPDHTYIIERQHKHLPQPT